MRGILIGALLALPAVAQMSGNNGLYLGASEDRPGKPYSEEESLSVQCTEKPRSVLLETGIQIDVVYCGSAPNIATTAENQQASSDGKFYTVTAHSIHREGEPFPAYVLVYKPNADWVVPAKSLDTMGAIILKDGDAFGTEHQGWAAKQDSTLNQQGQDWLPARQIVMHNATTKQWVYCRIIRDTRHNLLYVLYQKDDEGGAKQENSFFDSFTVSANSFTPDPGKTPGAHLPPPYPNI